MLNMKQMQEIQDLKLRGYSINEIIRYYEERNEKPPSLPTIRKYYGMDGLPEIPNQNLQKEKAFDNDPFRSAIIEIVRNNPRDHYCISSVYDVLIEKFVERNVVEALPGNEQTLRNYIRYLQDTGIIDTTPENRRIYEYVFDTPPGDQMLLDFGQEHIAPGINIHFICMLLRYSRLFCVFAQDHKYNSEEACRALYRGFCKLGGRPEKLVIDQDAVFVADETYGEIVETRVFGDFCTEQELRLWVCNKADPESKGPVENLVGFVKKNFFSARNLTSMDDVWKAFPGWVERKNKRIHQSTFRIPLEVFTSIEKDALRPLVSSFYENSPSSFIPVEVNSVPYLQYKSSRYSVPGSFCFKRAYYKVIGDNLYVYDMDRKYECTHTVSECKGSINRLEEHRKEPSSDWVTVMENLRSKWNCYSFQHFINGFKKENPRHVHQQLSAVEKFLDSEKPSRTMVSQVMDECCRDYRYRFSQFKVVYDLAKAGYSSPAAVEFSDVQRQGMEFYKKAFDKRCSM